ncbi:serine-rich protein [Geosmithia morbida]|uniref:Serine-rich protein n=1 Tax=Geosmithia morbida TaxID=1094350 RepID=A0A9P4YR51_9HYPO|nr:serine-rich protein [Geosmithia morbida]KAF4120264.1 serine-rich protein [Geosmithia morbida]
MSESPAPQRPAESSLGVPGSSRSSAPNSNLDNQDNDKLQIRVVPYSPPRISSGATTPHGRDGQGSRTQHGGVSSCPSPSGSTPTEVNSADNSSGASSLRSLSPRPKKRTISINSDKTFSLVPHSESSLSSRVGSFGSPQFSLTTPSSAWGRVSSSVFFLDNQSTTSFAAPLPTRRYSSGSAASSPPVGLGCSPIPATAPWGNRIQSGTSAHKVETSPDTKGKQPVAAAFMSSPISEAEDSLPPLPENTESGASFITPELSSQASFQSNSTLSDRTNYKIYGESSPVTPGGRQMVSEEANDSLSPSPENPNYQIIGVSSPATGPVNDESRPPTGYSDANYVVYGHSSASSSSPTSSDKGNLRPEFSRESLVVAPLRPAKQRSFHRSRISKSRSRESVRHGSLSSLGTALSQEVTRALFVSSATPSSVHASASPEISWQDPWKASPGPEFKTGTIAPAMSSHQHQWSRPLSTVMSESEGGSESGSRALSQFSITDRRSSGFHSMNSLNLLRNASPERPTPTYNRKDPSAPRPVRDYDEDGDGLADLEHLHPSWARLPNSGSSSSLERGPRSSGSTRSINPFTLPAWARLYYGSGEQRFIIAQASTDSIRSMYNGSMYNDPLHNEMLSRPPPTSRGPHSRVPSADNTSSPIRNPRRRPLPQTEQPQINHAPSNVESSRPPTVSASTHPNSGVHGAVDRVRRKTSSIWSPHLRRDRRSSGYSIWDPPSVVWSAEGGFHWRSHPQLVLFVLGFLIPFAWMAAALLPLPPKPHRHEMTEDPRTELQHDPSQSLMTIEEVHYNSTRRWRNLNRGMSVVGLLIIGAVVALAIVGVNQSWGA